MARLFGTDGVRGVVNEFLTPELAYHLGRAAAAYFAAFAAFCDDAHHREPCQFVPGPCGALYGACRNLGHECGPACSGLYARSSGPSLHDSCGLFLKRGLRFFL